MATATAGGAMDVRWGCCSLEMASAAMVGPGERGWEARKREGRGDDRGYRVRTVRVSEPHRGWDERERLARSGTDDSPVGKQREK
jgi:hypothetical protein